MSLAVLISAVGVVISPGKLIRLPPTVSGGAMYFRFLRSYFGHKYSIGDCPTCQYVYLGDREDCIGS